MSTSELKVHIEKLTGKENWEFWKENILLLLDFQGLLGVVNGTEKCPDLKEAASSTAEAMDELEKFRRKDTHAKLLITTNIEKNMRRKLGVVETVGMPLRYAGSPYSSARYLRPLVQYSTGVCAFSPIKQ
uniref:Retrotransposon Copia-like N-terminal domain-containing protein n=1 Tax=Trichuris muris TaxID=70415 RepID=A0A5S6R5G9_TRIMR